MSPLFRFGRRLAEWSLCLEDLKGFCRSRADNRQQDEPMKCQISVTHLLCQSRTGSGYIQSPFHLMHLYVEHVKYLLV